MKRFISFIVTLLIYTQVFSQIPGILSMSFKNKPSSPDGKYQTYGIDDGYIYRSEDGGNNWTQVGSRQRWVHVALNSTGQYQLAANGNTGNLYRSTDYGVTWNAQNLGIFNSFSGVAISSTGQYQVVTAYSGTYNQWSIYVSSNYGASFSEKYYILDATYIQIPDVSISSSGQYQTAIISDTGGQLRCLVSRDYGATWAIKAYLAASGGNNNSSVAMSSSGQYQTVTPRNYPLQRSTDYGETWNQVGTVGTYWTGLEMSSSGQYQTATTLSGTIQRSTDYGETWNQVGPTVSNYIGVAMNSTGQYQTTSGSSGGVRYLYKSVDYGATWTKSNSIAGYTFGVEMNKLEQ